MKRVIYDKLVRDKIPEVLKEKGVPYELFPPNEMEEDTVWKYALDKLTEECNEVKLSSLSREATLGELADVLEVVRKIADLSNISYNELEKKRKEKAKEFGTFKNNVVLLHIMREEGEE